MCDFIVFLNYDPFVFAVFFLCVYILNPHNYLFLFSGYMTNRNQMRMFDALAASLSFVMLI